VTFGLGTARVADRVVVEWPSGMTETARSVKAGSYILDRGSGHRRGQGFSRCHGPEGRSDLNGRGLLLEGDFYFNVAGPGFAELAAAAIAAATSLHHRPL